MKIVVIGPAFDDHVRVVADHLVSARVDVSIIDTQLEPMGTFLTEANGLSEGSLGGTKRDACAAVWLFRPRFANIDIDGAAPEDRPALAADISIFENWMTESIAPGAAWVNPFGAHLRGSNRVLQMHFAKDCGLTIPSTLISNDPAEIRAFIAAKPALLKPISRHATTDRSKQLLTTRISMDDLPPDEQLRVQPCYLQQEITKVAEWRVHIFGDDTLAVRLHPKSQPDRVDWNFHRSSFQITVTKLPDAVDDASISLVKALGLRFACLDFLEDSHGGLHFLESNQMGRFVWLDRAVPEAKISRRFADYLIECGQARV